jgi:hypothetical protein
MKKYAHLKEKAIKFRKKGLSIDDLCSHFRGISRSTIFYWVKNIPIPRTKNQIYVQTLATKAAVKKHKDKWEKAYNEALEESPNKFKSPMFRDFIILYITEGFRRTRWAPMVANSNPVIMSVCNYWFKELSNKKIEYILRLYEDHDFKKTLSFWSNLLSIKKEQIEVMKKNNNCKMKTRNWRNEWGILTIRVNDTYFRSRLQAYMDYLQKIWEKHLK